MFKRSMSIKGCSRVTAILLLALVFLVTPLTACEDIFGGGSEDSEDIMPVIFIPGITGSMLVSPSPSTILWPPGGPGADIDYSSLRDDFWRLSLNPQTGPHEDIYASDVIRDYGSDPIYSPFLNFLKREGGYIEYEVNGNPARRTTRGAYSEQEPKPSLFVFAYDWRLPIEENAHFLSEYVEVVSTFYPEQKVNIVTHSMGGLVARRYIIDHPNKVNKLITIAAPFLGSAKPLYQMIYGKLSAPAYYGKEAAEAGLAEFLAGGPVKDMLTYYPGLHELMLSRGYFALGGPPYTVVETATEAAASMKLPETKVVSYVDSMGPGGIVDQLFPNPNANGKSPAATNRDFHSYSANGNNQDDWSNDTTGVKYYHLIGVQSTNDTPLSIREAHGFTAAQVRDYTLDVFGPGDGTVPRLSAERIGNGQNYNAPNAKLYIYDSGPDSLLEHTGIMLNQEVMSQVLEILQEEEVEGEKWVLVETLNPAGGHGLTLSEGTGNQEGSFTKGTVNLAAGSMLLHSHSVTWDRGETFPPIDTVHKVWFDTLPQSLNPGDLTSITVSRDEGYSIYYFGAYDPEMVTSSGAFDFSKWIVYDSYVSGEHPSGNFDFIVPDLYEGELRIRFSNYHWRDLFVEWIYRPVEE